MEDSKLIKVVCCFLMKGDNYVDYWLNKYYDDGDSKDIEYKSLPPMIQDIIKSIRGGAEFSIEIYDA